MNGITILIWITIAVIGIIAIILVKLNYSGKELENDEESIIPNKEAIGGILSRRKSGNDSNHPKSLSPERNSRNHTNPISLGKQDSSKAEYDIQIVPQNENNSMPNYEYENSNQVLINYGNEVEKFQEPIKQSQMDIMTQNNKEKTELKDLFTIDELIKESKRKDSEREKESQKISKDDEDLTEIKASIENKKEEALIEEIIEKEETIGDLINESKKEESISELISESEEDEAQSILNIETDTLTSQKDIDEAITTASQESKKEEVESISESKNITDALLDADDDEKDIPNEEIKEPTLKTPNKVGESEFGASVDDANVFEDNEDGMDLDYRKDLDKFTNKIKESKIFQEVKDKFTPETEEANVESQDESYIRNVNDYEDEFAPIINETHVDIDGDYEELHSISYDERLRSENTRRVFKSSKKSLEPEKERIEPIKEKPARNNIKININNNEVVLKKGDEIIFNHDGETYSSQVYAINGDDISVRYRRKDIKIKPGDVKKIY